MTTSSTILPGNGPFAMHPSESPHCKLGSHEEGAQSGSMLGLEQSKRDVVVNELGLPNPQQAGAINAASSVPDLVNDSAGPGAAGSESGTSTGNLSLVCYPHRAPLHERSSPKRKLLPIKKKTPKHHRLGNKSE